MWSNAVCRFYAAEAWEATRKRLKGLDRKGRPIKEWFQLTRQEQAVMVIVMRRVEEAMKDLEEAHDMASYQR